MTGFFVAVFEKIDAGPAIDVALPALPASVVPASKKHKPHLQQPRREPRREELPPKPITIQKKSKKAKSKKGARSDHLTALTRR